MTFHGREAVQIENSNIRVTVLREGGHIAEILHKDSGVNPLWIPPWKSIEPSQYDPALHPEYGLDHESSLLAGIMGHNLCLDLFGPPSEDEAAAGMPVHGESSVVAYECEVQPRRIHARANLPLSTLAISREITIEETGNTLEIAETVENLSETDRPIGWTQHVTLGPPFLQRGVTRLATAATRSRVYEDAGFDTGNLKRGADFTWPLAPTNDGKSIDLSVFTSAEQSSKFTTHLMDRAQETAWFEAHSPETGVVIGYRWNHDDFPWLGIWEENHSRSKAPWNSSTMACGLEFGASPFPETRRKMIDRGRLFDVPGFRWIPAKGRVTARYSAFIERREKSPANR